LNACR